MLTKIIANALCIALLVNTGMIVSAEESNVEEKKSGEMRAISSSLETTAAETDSSVDDATTTEAENPAEVGKTIRKNLEVNVYDVISFDDSVTITNAKGKAQTIEQGEIIWLVGIDDENQRFRVYVPRLYDMLTTNVYYLSYADCNDAKVNTEEDGLVIGDLTKDGIVDVFDMCLMRRGFIYGWNDMQQYYMADMNADGLVTVADIVYLQRWLLGMIK